uniref:SERPIN domain-containing protein n=1 Tax=Caenorhabditis tropicalis TaxID=1561998 RepID=A0A1I7V289_9PELO
MSLQAETQFGLNFLQTLPVHNESLVFSPISIALVLSLLHTGARGKTKEQIETVLLNGSNATQFVNYFTLLNKQIKSGKKTKRTESVPDPKKESHSIFDAISVEKEVGVYVHIANRIYLKEGFSINPSFISTIQRHYQADAKILLSSVPEAVQEINNFVNETTIGNIPSIVSSENIENSHVLLPKCHPRIPLIMRGKIRPLRENITSSNSIENSNSNQSTVEISPSSAFLQEELTKIAETCLTDAEYQELSGNLTGYSISRIISYKLCENGVPHIGLTELREALNFGPLHPWKKDYDYKRPNAEALASAPSLEAYYDLKEPWYTAADPRNQIILEKNLPPAIAFFDKRFPSIRKIYRMEFEEILQSQQGDLDRKTIDRMIEEFMSVTRKMKTATERMRSNVFLRTGECFRLNEEKPIF